MAENKKKQKRPKMFSRQETEKSLSRRLSAEQTSAIKRTKKRARTLTKIRKSSVVYSTGDNGEMLRYKKYNISSIADRRFRIGAKVFVERKDLAPKQIKAQGKGKRISYAELSSKVQPTDKLLLLEPTNRKEKRKEKAILQKIKDSSSKQVSFMEKLYNEKKIFNRSEKSKRTIIKKDKGIVQSKTRMYTSKTSKKMQQDLGLPNLMNKNKILASNNNKYYYNAETSTHYGKGFFDHYSKSFKPKSKDGLFHISMGAGEPSEFDELLKSGFIVPKSGRLKSRLELIFYNDAKRPPTESEYKSGNREGVYYARYVEYGFTTMKRSGKGVSYVAVPGKQILKKIMRPAKIKEKIADFMTAKKIVNFKYTKETAASLLNQIGDMILPELEKATPRDTGLMKKSWGWIISESKVDT